MSSRFAAAICCGPMRVQSEMGVAGSVVEIGPFEGRFFIALAHALAPGETALGIDLFDWPNPQVMDRFEANCARHGIAADRRITWKADSRTMAPEALLARLDGRRPRFVHIDGEHSRAALTRDLELATAVLAPAGVIVLDDMLHPGYPTLMVAVHEYLGRHPDMCVLAVDVDETGAASAELRQQVGRRHASAVRLPGDAPLRGDAVPGAVGLEAVDDLGVGPVEQVDAERDLTGRESMRQRDEEAALERPYFHDRTANAHLRLQAQQPAADGRREPRRHAGH
jgi:predicted O-methyltransferase YrrM